MRSRYFIQHVAIALFLIVFLVAANNSIGSSEEEQSVSKLIQLIAKLTARIEALEERIQVLEVQIKALEAEKGRSDEWHQVLRVIDGDTILISTEGAIFRFLKSAIFAIRKRERSNRPFWQQTPISKLIVFSGSSRKCKRCAFILKWSENHTFSG